MSVISLTASNSSAMDGFSIMHQSGIITVKNSSRVCGSSGSVSARIYSRLGRKEGTPGRNTPHAQSTTSTTSVNAGTTTSKDLCGMAAETVKLSSSYLLY